MALYKRGNTWWYEFTYAGKRIRQSAKTTRKTIAVEAEKRRRLELERGRTGLPTENPNTRIRTVSETLAGYKVNHRDKATLRVRSASAHVADARGCLLLSDVNQDRIIAYMDTRQRDGASNRTINIELATLSRAMGHT